MKHKPRIFLFIILNILISAGTILTVLWIWEKAHPRPALDAITGDINNENPNEEVLNSPQNSENFVVFDEDPSIVIYAVVGVGNLDVEYVEIRNQGENAVNPAGWQLVDEDGYQFIFPSSPSLILSSDGAIKVLTKSGNDSVIELYWQSEEAIWQSGERATLLDADGEIITTYLIP
jgi:hypothetical protein